MIKRNLFLFISLMSVIFTTNAQTSIGIEAGISADYLNTNISNRVSSKMLYKAGYTIAIPFQYEINQHLYIETAPDIIQKNYSIDRTDSLSGAYQSFINTYLQVPVMIKYAYSNNKWQLYAEAGMYGGYWLAARLKGNIPNIFTATESSNTNGQTTSTIQYQKYSDKYTFNSKKDNRLELGWVAGIGAQCHVNEKHLLIFSCRFYESLTQQEKQYMLNQIPQYNETFSFSVGYLISFN